MGINLKYLSRACSLDNLTPYELVELHSSNEKNLVEIFIELIIRHPGINTNVEYYYNILEMDGIYITKDCLDRACRKKKTTPSILVEI
jgi:hypothetical protein